MEKIEVRRGCGDRVETGGELYVVDREVFLQNRVELLCTTAPTSLWPVRKHRARNVDFLDGGGILGPSESIKGRTAVGMGTTPPALKL